jgi:moderate conductance mechanosensitive channel
MSPRNLTAEVELCPVVSLTFDPAAAARTCLRVTKTLTAKPQTHHLHKSDKWLWPIAASNHEVSVRMLKSRLRPLLILLAIFLAPLPGRSQEGQNALPPQPLPSLTPAQAQQAIDVLQSDTRREQLVQTLQVIAKVSLPQQSSPPQAQAPSADNLGVQLMVQVSDYLGDLSSQLAAGARTVSDFPAIWHWLVKTTTDPNARSALVDVAWKLAIVLACALAAEWIAQRAIRKPLTAVARCVPARARTSNDERPATEPTEDDETVRTKSGRKWLRRSSGLTDAWRILVRLPFVLARLIVELLPVIGFAAVGNLLLATGLAGDSVPRLVILAMVNAYVLCRSISCIVAALVSPTTSQPSLFVVRDETAAYIDVWARRIAIVSVFGVAVANVALLLGLHRPAYVAVVRLVILVVHLFVVIIILQCRRNIADLIRAPSGERGMVALLRNRLGDIWHIVAIVLNLALWTVWALRVHNGYALLAQYFLATVAVLAIARLLAIAITKGLDRTFRIQPDFSRQFPGLEARANRYFPVLRQTISAVIGVITIIALLEVWGIDAAAWFSSGQIGGRLLTALVTIAVAAVIALIVWEASNATIDRHLSRLVREGHYARSARLRTFLPMLRTTLLAAILTIVVLTTLSELGVNIAPLLAGAGIAGIAIGFGSQKLVQDVITGLFLLLENAMQVGDFVTVSGLSGVVENLSIRTIRLRAGDGSVHIVPFSSVTSVTNTNRGIGNAAISVNVAYREDTDRVGTVMKELAAEMRKESEYKPMMRSDFQLWGVDKVDASMATIVGQIECTDAGRWPVQREFYRRMKKRFQELDIEIAKPAQATVVLEGLSLQQFDSASGPEAERRRPPASASRL